MCKNSLDYTTLLAFFQLFLKFPPNASDVSFDEEPSNSPQVLNSFVAIGHLIGDFLFIGLQTYTAHCWTKSVVETAHDIIQQNNKTTLHETIKTQTIKDKKKGEKQQSLRGHNIKHN